MTLPVGDLFNRADANPIGGNWTTIVGQTGLKILSNEVTGITDGTSCAAYWNADSFNNDQYSTVTVSGVGTVADVGACCRMSTTAATYYFSSPYKTGKSLYKVIAGTYTVIASVTVSDFIAGDILGCQCTGQTLVFLKNGTFIASGTDSAITSGPAGLSSYEQACRLDNWEGGDLTSVPNRVLHRLKTRVLSKQGFRSNVLRRGKLGWREAVYRAPYPQATNPSTVITHTTDGALTGPGSTIVGVAAHKVKHPTTGVLTGQSSSIVGSAAHKAKHTTTGVLAGLVSAIAGTARRFRSHPTTGVLTGQGSAIVGSAAHKAKHTTTGVLTGPGSVIVGAARRFITHVTSGVLTGQGSTIVGSSAHKAKHTTTGALIGQGSIIVGSAAHITAGGSHVTSGVLTGQSSSIVGSAAHKAKHTTTGVLTGQGSTVAGSAAHQVKHATTGALVGQSASIAGSAAHKSKHTTTGALIGLDAIIAGIATNGTAVITKRFGVAYWKPVEKEEPIPEEEEAESWTEPDLFEKLKETRANHEAIVRKAQQAELMGEQQRIRLRKAQDDQIIEMYLRSKR